MLLRHGSHLQQHILLKLWQLALNLLISHWLKVCAIFREKAETVTTCSHQMKLCFTECHYSVCQRVTDAYKKLLPFVQPWNVSIRWLSLSTRVLWCFQLKSLCMGLDVLKRTYDWYMIWILNTVKSHLIHLCCDLCFVSASPYCFWW